MRVGLAALLLLGVAGCTETRTPAEAPAKVQPEADRQAIGQVLDAFHQAAAKADGTTYFGLFAPDGVFIGTDVDERWSVAEFRAYAQPFFSKGQGWVYTPLRRTVILGPEGRTAWFDEVLDSRSYGTSRGAGVLVRTEQGWRIAQYALSFPIPNDLADELTGRIRAFEGERARPRPSTSSG